MNSCLLDMNRIMKRIDEKTKLFHRYGCMKIRYVVNWKCYFSADQTKCIKIDIDR